MPASPPLVGLVAACHTPFRADGSLNLGVVEKLAEHLCATDLRGVFVGGSTGECHSLSVDERIDLADRWVDVAGGTELAVIVQVGHNCQRDAQRMAQAAANAGAGAISAMAPSYFRPDDVNALIDFLEPVAGAAPGLPFYYYDIPLLTGVSLSMPELLAQGPARIPNLRGIKYTNPDLIQLQECLQFDGGRFNILFGCDEALLGGLGLGCRGAVGSTYNFAAPLYRGIIDAFERGDLERARKQQLRSVRMVQTLVSHGFMAAAKTCMSFLGIDCGPVRPPLGNLTSDARIALHRELDEQAVLA